MSRDHFVVVFLMVLAFLFGLAAGARLERRGHDEYLMLTECPAGLWRYSWCVPTGCAVDLATHPPNWDCGSRAFQQMPAVKP